MFAIILLTGIVSGYLIGSICSAVIVSRLFSLPDPCQEGSLNPGATNVLRLAGKKYALIVLTVDVLKGLLPVVIMRTISGDNVVIISLTALAAVLGHIFPIFFRFKGGKGVATTLGVLLGLNAVLGLMVVLTWLAIAWLTRYSSLSSIVSTALAPFYSLFIMGTSSAFVPLLLITFLVLYKHQTNITRLLDSTEPKIGVKKTPSEKVETVADIVCNDTETVKNPEN